jgi:hypothetical protein
MTTVQATLLMAALGTFVQVIVGVYFYGRLSQKVESHAGEIDKLHDTDREQWKSITDHGQRLSYVEAKVNGKAAH